MKTLQAFRNQLKREKPYLKKKYGVQSLNIFGSYSRNEATPKSDIDVMVEFERPIGLEFVDLAEELEEILGVKVDLVSKNGIKKRYYEEIKEDLVHV